MISHSFCAVPAHGAMVTQINCAVVRDRVYSVGIQKNQKELTKTFMMIYKLIQRSNPLATKLFNLNFLSLEVVSR